MKYLFVTQHKKTWPIDLMCRVLGVSRQGYYHYRRTTEARLADPEHQEMLGLDDGYSHCQSLYLWSAAHEKER